MVYLFFKKKKKRQRTSCHAYGAMLFLVHKQDGSQELTQEGKLHLSSEGQDNVLHETDCMVDLKMLQLFGSWGSSFGKVPWVGPCNACIFHTVYISMMMWYWRWSWSSVSQHCGWGRASPPSCMRSNSEKLMIDARARLAPYHTLIWYQPIFIIQSVPAMPTPCMSILLVHTMCWPDRV